MPARLIETSIDIAASPGRVWAVLTDFAAMPAWNPFIRSIEGPLTQGASLSVLIGPPGRRPMRFKPEVLVAAQDRELRWRGSLPVPGLFTGEHFFILDPQGQGTHFRHGEAFSGLLVPLMGGMLEATRAGFEAMNVALKQEAERAAS
jgi:hypothetical protein